MKGMRRQRTLDPGAWGLQALPDRHLAIGGVSAVELARRFGTPLHVVDLAAVEATAQHFQAAFAAAYPGRCAVHYAFKCNGVPGIVRRIRAAGLKAEVMSAFELQLALCLGYAGEDIVVNGPGKPEPLLRACLGAGVRFIVADSLEELAALACLAEEHGRPVDVLLRLNPDFLPHGMNQGSATSSRRGSAFGLDLVGGEADRGVEIVLASPWLRCHGLHLHIGTGVHDARDYRRALAGLAPFVERTRRRGLEVSVLDVGGGFGARTSREMTQLEMLLYQGTGRMPPATRPERQPTFEAFAREIAAGVEHAFGGQRPELLLEPGRCIVGASQHLLLTVHGVKRRPGAGTWLITDGGLGTVTMPTFYEHHEVLLADEPDRPRLETVTITGPVCFAGDVVYRNKAMPRVRPGEVLAVMDSGAYFTALESSFGFPRPAIVAVGDGAPRLLRRRETFADMTARDEPEG